MTARYSSTHPRRQSLSATKHCAPSHCPTPVTTRARAKAPPTLSAPRSTQTPSGLCSRRRAFPAIVHCSVVWPLLGGTRVAMSVTMKNTAPLVDVHLSDQPRTPSSAAHVSRCRVKRELSSQCHKKCRKGQQNRNKFGDAIGAFITKHICGVLSTSCPPQGGR